MPLNHNLIDKLKADFPDITFKNADCFSYSPKDNTIQFNKKSPDYPICLFHELAHGILNHTDYSRDIELVKIESEAWYEAINLAKKYGVAIDESEVQSIIDTYRDWLHSRSVCPNCGANGIQINANEYNCLACNHKWRVNEAKKCGLKRYLIKK